MPFKLKRNNLFKRRPKFSKKDLESICPDMESALQDFHLGALYANANGRFVMSEEEEDSGDASSISSFSTNATADDMPGPGRLLDKYVYQYFGRKLEKSASSIAMWLNIFPPSPAQIIRYFQLEVTAHVYRQIDVDESDIVFSFRFPKQIIDGLKSLVKQTQSVINCYSTFYSLLTLLI